MLHPALTRSPFLHQYQLSFLSHGEGEAQAYQYPGLLHQTWALLLHPYIYWVSLSLNPAHPVWKRRESKTSYPVDLSLPHDRVKQKRINIRVYPTRLGCFCFTPTSIALGFPIPQPNPPSLEMKGKPEILPPSPLRESQKSYPPLLSGKARHLTPLSSQGRGWGRGILVKKK